MLDAKGNALTAKLLVDALAVRRNELDFYSFSLNAIILASTAIYLGALSVWGGYLFPVQHDHWNYPSRWLYHTLMIAGMMLQFLCMIVAILATIMAPGLALRGPAGSMDKAINGMRYLTEKLSHAIIVSLALFQCAMITYSWTQDQDAFPLYTSALMSASFLLGLILSTRYGRAIYNLLYFDIKKGSANLDSAAALFARTAKADEQKNYGSTEPHHQVQPQAASNYTTPDAAMADAAIAGVAVKPKQKGFFKQIWDGSA